MQTEQQNVKFAQYQGDQTTNKTTFTSQNASAENQKSFNNPAKYNNKDF
jgi:hypothetical protein